MSISWEIPRLLFFLYTLYIKVQIELRIGNFGPKLSHVYDRHIGKSHFQEQNKNEVVTLSFLYKLARISFSTMLFGQRPY
jgi:hypothetical protein